MHYVLFNLENNMFLNTIIQIQELTFCIYNGLGKLGHAMKQNIVEIDIVLGSTTIEIETETKRGTVLP